MNRASNKISFALAAVLFSAAAVAAAPSTAHAERILVMDQTAANSFPAIPTWLLNRLTADGHTVTRSTATNIPSTAGFDWLTIFGNVNRANAANIATINSFLASGGYVYIQGEVSCCEVASASAQALLRALVVGGGGIQFNVNTGASGAINWVNAADDCSTGTHAASRRFTGVNPANIIMRSGAIDTGARWEGAELVAGAGVLVSTGDLNIFTDGGSPFGGPPNIAVMHTFFPPPGGAGSAATCDLSGPTCSTAADCDDGNDCTVDACTPGGCTNVNASAGSMCSGGVCDGAGVCVECVTSAQCGGGTPICNAATNTCALDHFVAHFGFLAVPVAPADLVVPRFALDHFALVVLAAAVVVAQPFSLRRDFCGHQYH